MAYLSQHFHFCNEIAISAFAQINLGLVNKFHAALTVNNKIIMNSWFGIKGRMVRGL